MSKKRSEKKAIDEQELKIIREKMALETICPKCLKYVEKHMCRFCGATKAINDVSGNVIWMLNGRVVAAFKDEQAAYIQMAERSGIPKSEWPERFRS